MLLCPKYKECNTYKVLSCLHRIPHESIGNCTYRPCSKNYRRNIVCEEEFYIYMREAIDDKGK